jgi:hypothetical protein
MKVAFDALFITLFFRPSANVHHPLRDAPDRIKHFIETLSAANAKIVIPTPALGEFFVLAQADAPLYLAALRDSAVFSIVDYDTRAAIEAAEMIVRATAAGDKRGGATGAWQTIKIDWQIAAIAKVEAVDFLCSDDGDMSSICEKAGIKRKGIADLPPAPPQNVPLPLDPPVAPKTPTAKKKR